LAAIAAACAIFLLLVGSGWLPPLPDFVILLLVFGLLLCGLLAVASAIDAARPLANWGLRALARKRQQRELRDYIPHMTEKERQIIAYLLAPNQKMFTAASNGGYANTLLARGIVVVAARPEMPFSANDMPCAIPDHLWPVLVEHREQFPYTPPRKGQTEPHPWRVPWMVA
jgi:hypothetical protein